MAVLDMFRLDGLVAVITGASSGLGVAFAQAFAEAGADVALGARRLEGLESTQKLVEGIGRRAISRRTDVSSEADCAALVQAAYDAFGRVDVLINNAGLGTAIPASKETAEQFRQVIEVNLMGSYWMARECVKVMQPGSLVLNISSVLGLKASTLPQAAYSASKAAVIGLTKDLTNQWGARKGIRVNALAPGYFPSEMTELLPDGLMESIANEVPLRRVGDPAELAATAVFLASPAGGYITGVTLAVDGGMTMH